MLEMRVHLDMTEWGEERVCVSAYMGVNKKRFLLQQRSSRCAGNCFNSFLNPYTGTRTLWTEIVLDATRRPAPHTYLDTAAVAHTKHRQIKDTRSPIANPPKRQQLFKARPPKALWGQVHT